VEIDPVNLKQKVEEQLGHPVLNIKVRSVNIIPPTMKLDVEA
jgi:hypothetical protein